tara:strand:- start:91 stop:483 length:393 start_codon:yes stop_codon:yes gene_type:complete
MISLSIPTILGSGIQSILARYMAEKSDEGLDARTTYFFLAGMFSPVIFWPIISLVIIIVIEANILSIQGLSLFISLMIGFYLSSLLFLMGYDIWSEYRKRLQIDKFSKSLEGQNFESLIEKLNNQLVLLK